MNAKAIRIIIYAQFSPEGKIMDYSSSWDVHPSDSTITEDMRAQVRRELRTDILVESELPGDRSAAEPHSHIIQRIKPEPETPP